MVNNERKVLVPVYSSVSGRLIFKFDPVKNVIYHRRGKEETVIPIADLVKKYDETNAKIERANAVTEPLSLDEQKKI